MIKIYKIVYESNIIYIGRTKYTLKVRKSKKNYSVPAEIYKQSTIELIEETEDVSRERYWIGYYKSKGVKLMNIKGGDTGKTRAEYAKEYYKEYSKHYYKRRKNNLSQTPITS